MKGMEISSIKARSLHKLLSLSFSTPQNTQKFMKLIFAVLHHLYYVIRVFLNGAQTGSTSDLYKYHFLLSSTFDNSCTIGSRKYLITDRG